MRESAAAKEREVVKLMMLISDRHPELVDEALTLLVDPGRPGWKKFRRNWLQRLGYDV